MTKTYKKCIDCGKRPEECKCENPVFRKVFEHAPSGIPSLDEEQSRFLEKELNRPPTKEEIEHLKECRFVGDLMQNGFPETYRGELLTTQDGKQWIYDVKHHEWIDVSVDNDKLRELIKNAKKLVIEKHGRN